MKKYDIKKCYWEGILSFILAAISIIATALQSRYAGKIVDVLSLKNYHILVRTFFIFILLLVVSIMTLQISKTVFNVMVERICMVIGDDLLSRYLNAKVSDVICKKKEDILQVIYNDIEYIRKVGNSSFLQFLLDLAMAVTSLVMMAILYFPFCLVCIAVYPLNIIAVRTNGLKQQEKEGISRKINIEGERMVTEVISSIRDIKLLGKEEEFLKKYSQLQEKWADITQRKYIVLNIFKNIPRILDAVVPAVILVLGFFAIENGNITLGTITTVISLVSNVNKPIRSFSDFYVSIKNLKLIKTDMKFYLNLENEYEEKDKIEVEKIQSIEFLNVSVVKHGKYILKRISFKICSGEKIAVVGPSGAGKSTILKLILKIEECYEGRIIINGKYSLDEIDTKKWRRTIGTLLQKNTLFNESVEYNLDIFQNWDRENGIKLLKMLGLEKFSKRMDMIVGNSVQRISGGERQRLCIAQLMTKKNKMLVLDEPTSALDEKFESDVMECLFHTMYDKKIILYTTHRLKTLSFADKILFVCAGKIVGFSNYQDLMENNHEYKAFLETEEIQNEIES